MRDCAFDLDVLPQESLDLDSPTLLVNAVSAVEVMLRVSSPEPAAVYLSAEAPNPAGAISWQVVVREHDGVLGAGEAAFPNGSQFSAYLRVK